MTDEQRALIDTIASGDGDTPAGVAAVERCMKALPEVLAVRPSRAGVALDHARDRLLRLAR